MKIISNAHYIGTPLEGVPVQFHYLDDAPEKLVGVYKVNESITFNSWEAWNPLPENPTLKKLQVHYLHDLSHAILYFIDGRKRLLLKNDFGLSRKHISMFSDDTLTCYGHRQNLLDEYKVIVLHNIIRNICWQRKVYTPNVVNELVLDNSKHVWHIKRIYKNGTINPRVEAERVAHVAAAVDYWYDMGISAIESHIRDFVKYLQTLNLKVDY